MAQFKRLTTTLRGYSSPHHVLIQYQKQMRADERDTLALDSSLLNSQSTTSTLIDGNNQSSNSLQGQRELLLVPFLISLSVHGYVLPNPFIFLAPCLSLYHFLDTSFISPKLNRNIRIRILPCPGEFHIFEIDSRGRRGTDRSPRVLTLKPTRAQRQHRQLAQIAQGVRDGACVDVQRCHTTKRSGDVAKQ